ncbi:MAG: DUF2497 domain-containing protein [Roseibium sp.]
MAQANKAEEPSMEEILASIRRIISDEDSQNGEAGEPSKNETVETAVAEEAADDMGDASEMSQDDLDKLFDMDGDDDDLPAEDASPEDDGADDMAAAMAADAAEDDGEDEDVLELTEELAVADDGAMDIVDGLPDDLDNLETDVSFASEPEPEPDPEPLFEAEPEPVIETAPAPAPIPASTMETVPIPDVLPTVGADGPLTSSNTGASVNEAFDNLANMFVGSQAQTVEELVKEMLRPMLKAWLDQNLPGMVEQMVQKEIQRVTRGRP